MHNFTFLYSWLDLIFFWEQLLNKQQTLLTEKLKLQLLAGTVERMRSVWHGSKTSMAPSNGGKEAGSTGCVVGFHVNPYLFFFNLHIPISTLCDF